MKLSKLKRTIGAYADALKAANADYAARGLAVLASFLDEFASKEIIYLVQRAAKAERIDGALTGEASDNSDLPAPAEVACYLDSLVVILASAMPRGDCAKDVTALAKVLRRLGESETLSATLDKLRDAMKPEPVDKQIAGFIERLKKDTGTPSFDRTFDELATSPLKREHVVSVAASVYGRISKSTSRKAALEFIRRPHDAYVSAKRGIDASGGRSAA